jgi:hypothetical protein
VFHVQRSTLVAAPRRRRHVHGVSLRQSVAVRPFVLARVYTVAARVAGMATSWHRLVYALFLTGAAVTVTTAGAARKPYAHQLSSAAAREQGERELLGRFRALQAGVVEGRATAVALSRWGLLSSLNQFSKQVISAIGQNQTVCLKGTWVTKSFAYAPSIKFELEQNCRSWRCYFVPDVDLFPPGCAAIW